MRVLSVENCQEKRSLWSETRIVLLCNGVNALAGLGLQSILARSLLVSGRGEYAACILFVSLLTLFFSLGQELANVHFVAARRLDASEAFSQSALVGLVASLIACAGGFAATYLPVPLFEKAPIHLFRLVLVCVPAVILRLYLTRILLGARAVGWYSLLTAAPRIVGLLILLAMSPFGLTVGLAIGVFAAAEGISLTFVLWILWTRLHVRLILPTRYGLARSLSYGLRAYIGKLASAMNVQIGPLVLAMAPLSSASLGLFMPAVLLAARLWMLPEALQVVLLPRVAEDPVGQAARVAQCVRVSLAATLVVSVLVFILGDIIIRVLLSSAFAPVTWPFRILLIGITIRVIPKVLAAFFGGAGRPGITSVATGASVFMNLVLGVLMLSRWGLPGLSGAMALAYAVEAIIMGCMFCRLTRTPWRCLLFVQRDDLHAAMRLLRARSGVGSHSTSPNRVTFHDEAP